MRRVVVVGAGVVSPIGVGRAEFTQALYSGRSGLVFVPEMEKLGLRCRVGGLVPGREQLAQEGAEDDGRPLEVSFVTRAAAEAVAQAGLEPGDLASPRAGSCVACETVATGVGYHVARALAANPRSKAPLIKAPTCGMPTHPSVALALRYRLGGRVAAVNASCTGGLAAIGQASEWIRAGVVDRCLAGGTDLFDAETLCRSFDVWRALAADSNDHPERACRPYDRTRAGFILGEGAAIVALEERELARARGATILAEISGFSLTNDGADLKQPTGEGLERAVANALAESERLGCGVPEYVNPHGAGTRLGDAAEVAALGRVFGERRPWVSSLKGVCGHAMAGAGAIELLAVLTMLREGYFAPTANLTEVGVDCDAVRHVPREGLRAPIDVAMTTNMGLGGTNAALVLSRQT